MEKLRRESKSDYNNEDNGEESPATLGGSVDGVYGQGGVPGSSMNQRQNVSSVNCCLAFISRFLSLFLLPEDVRLRALPHARHCAALLREAPDQGEGLHDEPDGEAAAAREVHHRGEEGSEARQAALCLPGPQQRPLPLQVHLLHHEDEEPEDVDTPNVPGAAGAIDLGHQHQGVLGQRAEKLLGDT